METRTYKVFSFEELSKEGKQKAIVNYGDINTDYDWYQYLYDDAKTIGLKIEGFDLYKRTIEGQFIDSVEDVIKGIKANHGKSCTTYKTMIEYKAKFDKFPDRDSDSWDDLRHEFLHALLEDYLSILQQEYEYLTSDKVIIETFDCNECMFTEDGKID
jgi:hypothetical protein